MADEHNQLQEAAVSLDKRLAGRQRNPGTKETGSAENLPEDMTAVPDTRDVAASRDAASASNGEDG